jgi:hypothetical protein
MLAGTRRARLYRRDPHFALLAMLGALSVSAAFAAA